ncbi:MAG: SMI1/KNR4 family protein [Gemmataceae bacterium]|nr:SMI1/KNR4 family protein [Gemmataceae bacterium]
MSKPLVTVPLAELLPAPPIPCRAAGKWEEAEALLGISFPSDYKWYIERYGSGVVSGRVHVLNALYEPERKLMLDTLDRFRRIQQVCLEQQVNLAISFGDDPALETPPLPYSFHPEPGGLFPWGIGQDGWHLFWHRVGDPEQWSVVATYQMIEEHYPYPDRSLITFLADLLRESGPPELHLAPIFDAGFYC